VNRGLARPLRQIRADLRRSRISLLRKTFAAEDRPALCGPERHGGFLAALRARSSRLHPGKVVSIALRLRAGENGNALGLARLTALRFVPELFIGEKLLFPGGKDEINTAVDTGQYLILKFH
jgi:hypothetical protein